MKSNNEYGKVVDGRFFCAPNPIRVEDRSIGNPPKEVLVEQGYKPVVLAEPIPDLKGKKAVITWEEKDDCIVQWIDTAAISVPYVAQFRSDTSSNSWQLHEIENTIKHIGEYEKGLLESKELYYPAARAVYEFYAPLTGNGTLDEVIALLVITDERRSHSIAEEGKHILEKVEHLPAFVRNTKEDELTVIQHILSALLAIKEFRDSFERMNCRMILCYLYSIFEDFLNKLIRTALLINPEHVKLPVEKNTEKTVEWLKDFSDIDAFKDELIRIHTDKQGKGYKDRLDYLEKTFGIVPQIEKTKYWDDMILLCEERNVLVHKGGVIDDAFLKRVAETTHRDKYKKGNQVIVEREYVAKLTETVKELCDDLTAVLEMKFPEYR